MLVSTYIHASTGSPGITIRHQESGRTVRNLQPNLTPGSTSEPAHTTYRAPDSLQVAALSLAPNTAVEVATARVTVINIPTLTPSPLGSRGESLRRSEILNLLITPICFRIHELRRRFPTEECRPASWPRVRHQVSLGQFRIFRNDVRIRPGEDHPFNPAHTFTFGLNTFRQFALLDVVLTLHPEQEALYLTMW
jgi:hypothetical protein